MSTEAPISVAVQLSSMEPLCGAALAICLGYLALHRFRYRDRIERAANDALVESVVALNDDAHSIHFGVLYWLAGSSRLSAAEQACDVAKRKNLTLHTGRPEGATPAFYDWFFRARLGLGRFTAPAGELVVVIAAIFAFVTLVAGVCANAKVWICLPDTLTGSLSMAWILAFLIFGAVVPVLLILLGRRTEDWGLEKVRKMSALLQVTAGKMARKGDEIKDDVAQVGLPKL
jgi:hypothetical protein